jgi:hypothetical protein
MSTPSSTPLSNFLSQVATNPKVAAAFASDPTTTVAGAGLPAAAQQAVLSGNSTQISNALLAEKGITDSMTSEEPHIVIVVVLATD